HKRFGIVQLTFHSFYTNIEALEPFLEIKNDRQLIVTNCIPSFHLFWEISSGVNGTGCRIVCLCKDLIMWVVLYSLGLNMVYGVVLLLFVSLLSLSCLLLAIV